MNQDMMEMNEESQKAWDIIEKTSANLFLTGKAGTGKTTFLKELRRRSPKRMVVLAPTGIAAINAGGVTIHSFFQLPLSPYLPGTTFAGGEKKRFQFSKVKRNIIRTMDLLVIDEISMVRSDLLDAIDSVMRRYRRHDLPFGGVQLLMIGDLQQLAPVVTEHEEGLLRQYYDTPFFFSSKALQQACYLTIELKTVYRQQDEHFVALLNQIRENKASDETLAALNQRYIPDFQPPKGGDYIRLTTHNIPAQHINEQELGNLPSQVYSFTAEVEDNFPESSYPADYCLQLKVGAQIMFIKNDAEHRFYNGMIGEVTHIENGKITVRGKDEGVEFLLDKAEWSNSKYTLNEQTQEIEETVEGVFRQYPVRLAWAITIHKSQGLTFEHAIIDASHSFTHGQTYVALSRCKSLEGMVLSTPLSRSAIISDSTVDLYNDRMVSPTMEQIATLQQLYVQQCIGDLFDFRPMQQSYELLMRCLVEYFMSNYPRLVAEYQKLSVVLKSLAGVSDKFRLQYTRMLSANPDVSDEALQERINKAAHYFWQKIGVITDLVKKSNLSTDNKTAKKQFEDRFSTFAEEALLKQSLLRYEQEAEFSVSDFLKKKAQFLLAQSEEASSGGGRKRKSSVAKEQKIPKAPKTPTKQISLELFKEGMNVEQIAKARGLAQSTIISHLVYYVRSRELGLRSLIPSSREKKIRDFMQAHPEMNTVSAIREALGGIYEYWEIQLVKGVE